MRIWTCFSSVLFPPMWPGSTWLFFSMKCVCILLLLLSYSAFLCFQSLSYCSASLSTRAVVLVACLVWLYPPPHACGGARLSCIVASRFAQNWHFSCAQKTHGEALVCTTVLRFSYIHPGTEQTLNSPPPTHTLYAWSRWSRIFPLSGVRLKKEHLV